MSGPRGPMTEENKELRRGKVWVRNNDLGTNKLIKPEKLQVYLDSGYELGKLPHSDATKVKLSKPRGPMPESQKINLRESHIKHKPDCMCVGCRSKRVIIQI